MSIVDPCLAMADADLLVESASRRRTADEEPDWSSLPGDILEQALALLSLPEVFRLRCVCKRWTDLIHCAQFQERALRKGLPWGPFYLRPFYWKVKRSCTVPWFAYDLSETTVRKTTMPQLELPECARQASWRLIVSGGGLLCFAALSGQRRILVCNPMTKAWRELPNVNLDYRGLIHDNEHRLMVTHMVVNECRSSYKILFAGKSFSCCSVVVDLYDSAAKKWSAAEPLSPKMNFRSGAYLKGEMYLLGMMVGSDTYKVKILELATLRWREGTIPMPTTYLDYPHIVTGLWEEPGMTRRDIYKPNFAFSPNLVAAP